VRISGVILTGFAEWSYLGSRFIVLGDKTYAENAIVDTLMRGLPLTRAKPDILYTLDDMRRDMPDLRRVIVWVNWLYNEDDEKYYQASYGIKPWLSQSASEASPEDWNVGAYTVDTAPVHTDPMATGTPSDESILWILRELRNRGYEVGLLPTIRSTKPAGAWRGELKFRSEEDFTSFAEDFKAMYQHYADLVSEAGITLDYFIIGSEMVSSTIHDPPDFPFIDTLIEIASHARSAIPGTKLIYAANWDEYSYRTTDSGDVYFPLDRLLASGLVDFVGLDYYFPLTIAHSSNPDEIYAGTGRGIDWDVYIADPGPGGHKCSESLRDGSGFTRATLMPLEKQYRRKDIRRFWDGYHFEKKDTGGKTYSLPPNRIALELKNGARVESTDANGPGVWLKDELGLDDLSKSWLALDTDSYYARGRLPITMGEYRIRTVIDLEEVSSDYSRIIRFPDVLDVFYDRPLGEIKLAVYLQDGSVLWRSFGAVSLPADGLDLEIIATTSRLKLIRNGSVVLEEPLSSPPKPIRGEYFIGTYNGWSDYIGGKLYFLRISNPAFGNDYQFHFLEPRFGVVSEWTPRSIPMWATEVGLASINSATVTPYSFPDVVFSCTGPWNTTFNRDDAVQSNGLEGVLRRFDEYISDGFMGGYFVYCYDARPRASWDAKLPDSDVYYYADRNNLYVSMPVNGKISNYIPPYTPSPSTPTYGEPVRRRHKVHIYSDVDDEVGIAGLVYDEESVAQAVRNLLLTIPGEHIFNPELGCDLDLTLFEPLDDVWMAETRHIIISCLSKEPRIIVHSIDFEPDYDYNFVKVILTISIKGIENPSRFTIEVSQ